MNENARHHIRQIFLSHRPNFVLMTASILLGMSYPDLQKAIADGAIVASSTRLGLRISREEMVAVAFDRYEQALIEDALGDEAASILPEALRLVELRARVPRYQREMLRYFARRDATSMDSVLSAQLDDVASANSEELCAQVPGFSEGFGWPHRNAI